jgi:hypothetical protein
MDEPTGGIAPAMAFRRRFAHRASTGARGLYRWGEDLDRPKVSDRSFPAMTTGASMRLVEYAISALALVAAILIGLGR